MKVETDSAKSPGFSGPSAHIDGVIFLIVLACFYLFYVY